MGWTYQYIWQKRTFPWLITSLYKKKNDKYINIYIYIFHNFRFFPSIFTNDIQNSTCRHQTTIYKSTIWWFLVNTVPVKQKVPKLVNITLTLIIKLLIQILVLWVRLLVIRPWSNRQKASKLGIFYLPNYGWYSYST